MTGCAGTVGPARIANVVAEPLFSPVSFVRVDQEEIHYGGGSMIFYGQNGVGKSYLLEGIASSLQGEEVGRAVAGSGYPEMEGDLGVIARLRDGINGEDIFLLHAPPGQYPYDPLETLRQAVEASRSHYGAVVEDSELMAEVGEALDEFASLRLVFLAPLDARLGPGWRLHAVARGLGLRARGFDDPVGSDDVWTFRSPEDFERVTAYRFNGFKPHLAPELAGLSQTAFGCVIDDSRVDVASITGKWLKDRSGSRWVDGSEIEGETLDSLRALAEEWAASANQLLRTFMADSPELNFGFGDPAAWLVGDSPGWLGVDGLSFAERRWALIAIALTAETDDTPYLIIDEPERGLHRTAEAYLAVGLRGLVSNGRLRLIAATHSPEFIDTDFGQLFHLEVAGSSRWGSPKELTRAEVNELQAFGMQPTSLLSRDRGYLLVEGEHDKQIFEGWFAAELAEMRVAILAMRGTRNLWTVFDSELLIERTDALLMPLLDDIALEPLFDLWSKVEVQVAEGRRSDAAGMIRREMGKIPGGAKGVYEPLLTGTITRGVSQRFFPLGMSKKDVLEYLPVADLVDGAFTWEDLREEWKRSPASMVDRSGKAYKDWLRKVKRADLSPENLRLVAETTGGPPPELKAIIAKVGERLDADAPRSR